MRTRDPVELAATRPTTFQVGDHALVVTKIAEHRWSVAVDTQPVGGTYDTQAEAWEAGVRDAARIDAARGK
jgi:hypothetical protein